MAQFSQEDKKLRHQTFYLVGYLVKTGCTKRKKGGSEEVINVRVGWEKEKNESEDEKRKVSQKKRRITQERESGERKLVNLPNEEGVGVDHPVMEKLEERSGGVQDGVPFSFSFEGSGMRVEGGEEGEGEIMVIEMNEESARTTQARRESEGGKLVVFKKKQKKKNKQMMTKLRKKKNKKKKEKGLVDIRSSFGVGPQETPSPTTNLPNVTQSECLHQVL